MTIALSFIVIGLVRGNEWRPERLSLKKQLKLRCQEQNHSSGTDIALVRSGTSAVTGHPIPVSSFGQPSKDIIVLVDTC